MTGQLFRTPDVSVGRDVRSDPQRGTAVEHDLDRTVGVTTGGGAMPWLRDPLLIVYLFVIVGVLVPARMVVPPLGALGAPALILSVGAAVLYVLGRLLPGYLADGRQPVRTVLVVFGCAAIVAYAAGHTRALGGLEASASMRTAVMYLGYIGLGLLVADGLRDRDHLYRLIRLVVDWACVQAVLGIVQFLTDRAPETYILIPGLAVQEAEITTERSLFVRVQGTAGHPIEFGVVLAVALPLALHLAVHGPNRSRWSWLPVGLILAAVPMSVSRSSVLGVVVAALMVTATWGWRMRVNALVAAVLLFGAMRAAFPGLLGTLRSMFTWAGDDPSVQGRTEDYPLVWEYFQQTPWFGRGLGTFIPEVYFFLDNQFLGELLTGGVVGLAALVALFVVGIGLGRGVYHHAQHDSDRSLGQALAAATAVSLVTWLTYDGLAFRLNAGLMFIVLGATGALWRMSVGRFRWGVDVNRARPQVPRPAPPGASPGAPA